MEEEFVALQEEYEKQIKEIMKVEGKTREQVVKELDDMEDMSDLLNHVNGDS